MGIITRWRTAILIMSMVAALALIACGNESTNADTNDDAAALPTFVAPTATQIVVEVTAAPQQTETPAPTPAPEPTQKPAAKITKNLGATLLAETKAQPMIDFPIEITSGSPPLDEEQVLVHWSGFLEGSRNYGFGGTIIWELCPGGEGTWVYELGSPNFTGAKFDYELKTDPGGTWNSTVMVYKFRAKVLFDLMDSTGGAGNRAAFQPIKAGEPSNFHEATCRP